MIVSFSVSNFRSFSTEQTFSLVASNRLSDKHEDHLVPIPDSAEKVLRTAVVYGANGAGKSNLFKALRYLRNVALHGRKKNSGTGRQAFCFGDEGDAPSSFDLQFIVKDKLYRFGFKVDDERLIEEWLIQVIGGRERVVYERVTDESGNVLIEAPGIDSSNEKLKALVTVGGPPNQSFLATIQATLRSSEIGAELNEILRWLTDGLILIAPDESLTSLGHSLTSDSGLLQFAGEFLKSSSTGVDHLTILKNEISEEQLRNLLPKEVLAEAMEEIPEKAEGVFVVQLGEGHELLVERKAGSHYYRIRIQAAHEHQPGKVVTLALNEESDGTRRLLHLLPALHHLLTSSPVYFIDEIDRSLHPILVRTFLESFLKSCGGGPRQVIVTTHESNLLDQELLRRDEIWFAEKDEKAGTHLYSLMDFKVRNDLEIRKHYLQGRFGAVPYFGNLDQLLAGKALAE